MDGINQVWPKWQAIEVLGEGGFGKVYKAKRDSFGQEMYSAIKVVKIPSNSAEVKEMSTSGLTQDNIRDYYYKSVTGLVDEIKMMDRLKSAGHIVSIEDFEVVENTDTVGWTIYIRMELLINISDHMKTTSNQISEVKKMATHILSALEHCHELNIIHRDIKPANIFISKFGEYKLGDFGVSREVEKSNATMSQKGTKSYMAPEMIRLENYNKTVDMYALGLTMYELLNHNRMPFLPPFPENFYPSDREEAMLKRLMGKEFPDIEGIGELNDVIKKACHPNASLRYQTATEMKKAIMDIKDEPVVEIDEKEKSFTFDELSIEDDETTIGLFGGKSPFETKKVEKTLSGSVQELVNQIILDFKQKEGIDLSSDLLAKGRITSEATKAQKAFETSNEYLVDLPYIASTPQGAVHLKMVLYKNKEELNVEPKKPSGFLFGDEADEEPLQRKCPYCGKTAYLQFTHGYYCRSCDKMSTTTSDEQTREYANQMYQYLHCGEDYVKRLRIIEPLYKALPHSAQVVLKYGQTVGNLNRKDEQRQKYLEAYKLDSRDGVILNNLASSYLSTGDYQIGLSYSTKAVKAVENYLCSDNSRSIIYANHSISLNQTGSAKEAFHTLRKAHQAGYKNCDLAVKNWKIGEAYTQDIVTRVINKYSNRLSNKCRYDAKSLEAAQNKFKGYEKLIMACEPGLFGPTEHGIAFGRTSISYYAGKSNYFMPYYYFNQISIVTSNSKVTIKTPSRTFEINVGKDANVIAAMLSEIQSLL